MSKSNSTPETSSPVTAVDLFCGAGGLSSGLALACEELDREVELTAINHWSKAIETHKKNHPWARHLNAKVEELHPPDVAPGDGRSVDILIAAPECTHFSVARGGKPVNEQMRASPWHVIDWLEKLDVQTFLIENVPELESWGPVDEDGQPSRNGDIFEAWVNTLHSLGYSVDWKVLNSADYGDATSRKRLFIVGQKRKRSTFPSPTHSQSPDDESEEWRPASDIINWEDTGESIWSRSKPLVNNTMKRIAEGIRRHCDDALEPYADALDELGAQRDLNRGKDVTLTSNLRENAVSLADLEDAVEERNNPFFVELEAKAIATDGGDEAAHPSYVIGQHSGSVARNTNERPLPTIATRGAIALYQPETFILPRNGAFRGLHSNPTYAPDERPLHTVTANNHDGHLLNPFLIEYYGNGKAQPTDEPLPTVTTKARFALIVPDLFPWGLDINYRMLEPPELAAAMGFPDDYEFVGNKTETTKQIGNAVPVNLAKALCNHLLTSDKPSLESFNTSAQ